MNDDIIRMAREASSEDGSVVRNDGKTIVLYAAKTSRFLERFAALVRADERKRSAEVAYEFLDDPFLSGHGYATGCRDAILAGSQK